MRVHFVLSALALSTLFPQAAGSCSLLYSRQDLPESDRPRIIGRVVGYAEESRPAPGVDRAVSLRVDIELVISGRLAKGQRAVVPLSLTPSCGVRSMTHEQVARSYPVGRAVAVVSHVKPPLRWNEPIVVDPRKHGVIFASMPAVPRTVDGDMDFAGIAGPHWLLREFEFDRAVLALRAANRSQRFRRLLNLARYNGFQTWPEGRSWLDTLIAGSGLSSEQRDAVLEVFQASARRTP